MRIACLTALYLLLLTLVGCDGITTTRSIDRTSGLARLSTSEREPQGENQSELEAGPGGYWKERNSRTSNGEPEPEGVRLAAMRHMLAMDSRNVQFSPDWFAARGPQSLAGRTRCIAIHPRKTDIWIMATAGGGLWRTANGGATWVNCDDYRLNHSTNWVEFASDGTLYVGTGEPYGGFDALGGVGVYVSSDLGQTFSKLSTPFSDIFQIRCFKGDSKRLIALTTRGIYASNDSGATWAQTSEVVHCAAAQADGSERFWVVGPAKWISYTTDGGYNWVAKAPPGLPEGGRKSIAVNANDGNQMVIITGDEYAKRTSKVFTCSNAEGAVNSWNIPNLPESDRPDADWWSNFAWIDPANPEHIVSCGRFVYDSFNSGGTFSNNHGGMHPDVHYVKPLPGYHDITDPVLFCTDGGIYRTILIPIGAFYIRVSESVTRQVDSSQYYSADGFAGSGLSRIIGGTQDNGSWRLDKGSNEGTPIGGGDGGYAVFHPTNPDAYFLQSQGLALTRTLDNGRTITDAATGIPNAGNFLLQRFLGPIVIDPDKTNRAFVGGVGLYRTNNAWAATGPGWSAIGSISSANVSALAVAPGDPWLYIGTDEGSLFRLDRTKSSPVAERVYRPGAGNPPTRRINCITVDPGNPQCIYIGLAGWASDNLWQSLDGGSTWRVRSGKGTAALPISPVFSLAINPNNANFLHVGLETGICYSTNQGITWRVEDRKMIGVSVWDLKYMKRSDYLVAATHGRGVWTSQPTYVDKIAPTAIQDDMDQDMVCSLTGPPPPLGVKVTVTSVDDTIITPLTQAKFGPGVWTTYFKVRTPRRAAPATVTLSASYNGSIFTQDVTVIPCPDLTDFQVTPKRAVGGVNPLTSVIQLQGPVPLSSVPIKISQSPTGYVQVPGAIWFDKGQARKVETWNTEKVGRAVDVTLKALHRGQTLTQVVRLVPEPLRAMEITKGSVKGGDLTAISAHVLLSNPAPAGGMLLRCRTSDPAVSIPATVTVPAGESSIYIDMTHKPVGTDRTVVVKVANDNNEVGSQFELKAADLTGFTVTPSDFVGGSNNYGTGTVKIFQPAGPSGVVVTLAADSNLVVPASVRVLPGATTASFTLKHKSTGLNFDLQTVTAIVGTSSLSYSVVLRCPEVVQLTLTPNSVVGGSRVVNGKITINAPAPPGGLTINLSSDDAIAVPTPTSLTIPEGALVAYFKVSTTRPATTKLVKIQAKVAASGKFLESQLTDTP